jgi:5-methylcytosine-specific restriction endonuclease McrA
MIEFHPYGKADQLSGHKKKEKTKYNWKKPRKKKKKLATYKGRTIPKAKVRGEISKKEYNKAIDEFGAYCNICGSPYIEMHHIKFRSQGGRGGYRNLIPLCNAHHRKAHKDREFSERLRFQREKRFGEWFWADRFDLFKTGLIPEPTNEHFERFMQEQERMNQCE